ncbi:hypothetical protein V7024_21050 [Bacillus sp. JJ864]|uniref:hypothetical protein n=1 Tax=Bacillus sp. JJ864 TaxID=3122975 RepID=UPI002FFD74DC
MQKMKKLAGITLAGLIGLGTFTVSDVSAAEQNLSNSKTKIALNDKERAAKNSETRLMKVGNWDVIFAEKYRIIKGNSKLDPIDFSNGKLTFRADSEGTVVIEATDYNGNTTTYTIKIRAK